MISITIDRQLINSVYYLKVIITINDLNESMENFIYSFVYKHIYPFQSDISYCGYSKNVQFGSIDESLQSKLPSPHPALLGKGG